MSERLVYRNSDGVRRTLVTDGGVSGTLTEVDVDQLIDNNRALEEEQRASKSPNKLLARVPMTVIETAMREGWIDDEDKWRKWLNDPDNKHLRVYKGRV